MAALFPTRSASTTAISMRPPFPTRACFLIADAKGPRFHTDLPYRCLLPEGLDGILVLGLGQAPNATR